MNYPMNEEKIYQLELEFVTLLRNDKIDIDGYQELLEKLNDLSPCISEKTVYILHNILLYYQDLHTFSNLPKQISTLHDNLKKLEFQKIKK